MNKVLRDALIVGNPLVTGLLGVLLKATTDQGFTPTVLWLLGQAAVQGVISIYIHFLTSAQTPTPPSVP